jgi:hypothetical protein
MPARQTLSRFRTFTLLPRPCVHESAELPNAHPSFRSRLACLEANGVPGFEVRETR